MKTRLLRMLRKKTERRYKVVFIDGWWQCFEKSGSIWQPLFLEYLLPTKHCYAAYRTEAEALKAIDIYKRQYILDFVRPLIRRRNWWRLQKKIKENII